VLLKKKTDVLGGEEASGLRDVRVILVDDVTDDLTSLCVHRKEHETRH